MLGFSLNVLRNKPSKGHVLSSIYISRVIANGGIYEGISCLISKLDKLS